MEQDDPTTRAVDQLNRRLAGAQRSMVRAVIFAGVLAGGIAAGWTSASLHGAEALAFRLVVPAFLIAALATLGLGGLLVRGAIGRLKVVWARALAQETGARAEEVESFALPFGGPPGQGVLARNARQGATALGLTAAVVVVVAVVLDGETAIRVGLTIVSCVLGAAFWSYVGFRAPR